MIFKQMGKYISYARYVFISLRGKLGPEILLLQGKQVRFSDAR